MQRDAACAPQESSFRPAGNSPSSRHLTRTGLLCFSYYIFCIRCILPQIRKNATPSSCFSSFIQSVDTHIPFWYNLLTVLSFSEYCPYLNNQERQHGKNHLRRRKKYETPEIICSACSSFPDRRPSVRLFFKHSDGRDDSGSHHGGPNHRSPVNHRGNHGRRHGLHRNRPGQQRRGDR